MVAEKFADDLAQNFCAFVFFAAFHVLQELVDDRPGLSFVLVISDLDLDGEDVLRCEFRMALHA